MKNNKFQDKVKEVYATDNSNMDKLEMWNAIEKELPQKNKRRRFLWFYLVSGFMLLSIFAFFIQKNKTHKQDFSSVKFEEEVVDKKTITKEIDLNSNLSKLSNEDFRKNNSSKAMPVSTEAIQSKATAVLDEKALVGEQELVAETNAYDYSKIKKTNFSNLLISNTFLEGELKQKNKKDPSLLEKMLSVQSLKSLSAQSLKALQHERIKKSMFLQVDEKVDFKTAKNLSINLALIGSVYNSQDFGMDTSTAFESEHFYTNLLSFGSTLSARIKHKNGLDLSVGLESRILRQRFDWNGRVNEELIPTLSDSASYFIYDGVTYFSQGVVTDTLVTSRNLRHFNQVNTINIPLELGYTKQLNSWAFRIYAGAVINLKNRFRGKYLFESNQILENQDASIILKDGLVHHWNVGMDLGKNWKNGWGVFLRLQLDQSSNWRINVSENLQRRNSSVGIGLNYQLGT